MLGYLQSFFFIWKDAVKTFKCRDTCQVFIWKVAVKSLNVRGEAIPSSRWLAWIFLHFSGFFSRELLRHFRAQNLADFSSYSLHISLGPEVCSVRPGQRVAVPGWPRQPGDSRVLPGSDTRNKQPQGLKEFTITFFVCITWNVENSCFWAAVRG